MDTISTATRYDVKQVLIHLGKKQVRHDRQHAVHVLMSYGFTDLLQDDAWALVNDWLDEED